MSRHTYVYAGLHRTNGTQVCSILKYLSVFEMYTLEIISNLRRNKLRQKLEFYPPGHRRKLKLSDLFQKF